MMGYISGKRSFSDPVDDPPSGCFVREIHIVSDLPMDTQGRERPLDAIRRLQDVIFNGYLPFIHTLGLHFTYDWFLQLQQEFWTQLKEKCPRLRNLILKGFSHDSDQPWLEESGLLQSAASAAALIATIIT